MSFLELLLIGVGLSMDACAVAICQGLCMPKLNLRHAGVIGLFFGGFQALMPLIGWFLGSQFSGYIQKFDHWVAFVLLILIGGNMVHEAMGEEEEEASCAVGDRLHLKQLLLMAIATSIDALAVVVTVAFLAVSMGVISAVGGGMVRDVCLGDVPFVLRKRIYALAAIVGASLYYLIDVAIFRAEIAGDIVGSVVGVLSVVLIRILATHFKWNLPHVIIDNDATKEVK